MARALARWTTVVAVCLVILFIPIWTGALKAAEESYSPPAGLFDLRLPLAPKTERGDKDCIGDFESQAQAQRFFERHDPNRDPHHLDRDRDGKACEQFD